MEYTYRLTSNTFGRTYLVGSKSGGAIGLVQRAGDWWYASPDTRNSNRPVYSLDGGPHRSFKSRQLATAWLQGIADAQSAWFSEAMNNVEKGN